MNSRLAIRVDAHRLIALGHLKRCLALAEGLRRLSVDVLFVSMHEASVQTILGNSGFDHELISEEMNSVGDREHTLSLIRAYNASLIIADSYRIDPEYTRFFMEKGIQVVYIDDLARVDIECHVVVNGLMDAVKIPYGDVPVKLLGNDFLILGREYWKPPTPGNGAVRNILITMGGIDHYDLSTRALKILESHESEFSISVVIGAYYENRDEIEMQMKVMSKQVDLHFNPASLFPLMNKCDLAISAGGFTLYELVTMGKPAIGISVWENQAGNVKTLGDRDIIEPVFYVGNGAFDHEFKTAVLSLIDNEERRSELSINGRRSFDGKGAIRVAKHIVESMKGR